jgi:hypothetical protein
MNTPTSSADAASSGELLASGWMLYELTDEGFAIALPPDWEYLNLSPDGLEDSLGAVNELNPEFNQVFSSDFFVSLVANGLKFYGIDITSDLANYGLPSSVNVLKLDIGIAMPMETYISLNLRQLETIANEDAPLTNQRVQLGDIEAEEIKYQADIADALGQTNTVALTQYLMLNDTFAYVITLSSPVDLAESYEAMFEEISQSFYFIE